MDSALIASSRIIINPKRFYFTSPPLCDLKAFGDRIEIISKKRTPIVLRPSQIAQLKIEDGKAVLVYDGEQRLEFGVASRITTGCIDTQETCQLVASLNRILELRPVKFNNLLHYAEFSHLKYRKIKRWLIPVFILGVAGFSVIFFEYPRYALIWTVTYLLLMTGLFIDQGTDMLKKGVSAFEKENYRDAVSFLTKALKFYPEYPDIYAMLTMAYQKIEKLPYERYYLSKLILLSPVFLDREEALSRLEELTRMINDSRENDAVTEILSKYKAVENVTIGPQARVIYLPAYFDMIFYLYEKIYDEYRFSPGDEMTVQKIYLVQQQNQVMVNETGFTFSAANVYPAADINKDDIKTVREIFEYKRIERELEDNEKIG